MAKTPTVDVNCETDTKPFGNSNKFSKTKTPKENSSDGATQTEGYTLDDIHVKRRPKKGQSFLPDLINLWWMMGKKAQKS